MLSGTHLMSLHRKLLFNAKVRLTRNHDLALAIAPSLTIGFFLYLAWIQSHNSAQNPQIITDKKPLSHPPEPTFKFKQKDAKFIALVADKIADTVPLSLKRFDAKRHRAFWGIDRSGQPKIGISQERVDSVSLAVVLSKAGYREAVMVDSGASTSLTYQGKLLVKDFVPRPVPHAVALSQWSKKTPVTA
jgi:hypothetical protein